jgi:hypothetical protein
MHDPHHHPQHHNDMKPAFMGLILGAIALLIMCFAIVKFTNNMYAPKPGATATH